jgi:hypothetical protein
MTGAGRMSGETFKEIDSEIGRLARGYAGSAVNDERQVGDALRTAQKSLRDMLARQNPDKARAIRAADKAFAKLLRVENAGARVGAADGVFTPAQLRAAVRALDPSLRKRGFAHGKALMQDFAESGQANLPSQVANSGTTDRALLNALALGGGAYIDPSSAHISNGWDACGRRSSRDGTTRVRAARCRSAE